jgi:dephospho-CoA kinase
MRRPFVVGICGGIGSGKSTAARVFARLGARVIDADRLAHEVLTEPEVRAAVRDRFGEQVMRQGDVNRGALQLAVFGVTPGHDEARAALQAIVHPRILARIDADLLSARSEAAPPEVVVIDAPLLTEGPLRKICDAIVFVEAPEAVRIARTKAERNWQAEHHRLREKAQSSVEAKRGAATVVLENRGTVQDLERACEALYRGWVGGR